MFKIPPDNFDNLSKEDYEKIIHNIFLNSVQKSSNSLYGKYKSNIYSINEIEKSIQELPDIMDEVYKGLDLDDIYDYKNDDDK